MKDRLGIGDRRAASVGGGGSDRPSLSLRSEPGIVLRGGVGGEDHRAGGREENPVPRPSDPGSITRGRDPGRNNDHSDGGETDQERLHPHPHVAVEDISGREERGQADTPPRSDTENRISTPAISRGGGSEGMQTALFLPLPLTDSAGDPVVPDDTHGDAITPKVGPGWVSTAASGAKLLLRTVERASDAFPPLKSAAAGLCAILDSCEVRPPSFARSVVLTVLPANCGQQKNDRVVGIPGRSPC